MDCIVHGVTKSPTRLSSFHFHFHRQVQLLYQLDFAVWQTTPTCSGLKWQILATFHDSVSWRARFFWSESPSWGWTVWDGLSSAAGTVCQVEGRGGWALSPRDLSFPRRLACPCYIVASGFPAAAANPSTPTFRPLLEVFLPSHWSKQGTWQSPDPRMEKSILTSDGKICYVAGHGHCSYKEYICSGPRPGTEFLIPWELLSHRSLLCHPWEIPVELVLVMTWVGTTGWAGDQKDLVIRGGLEGWNFLATTSGKLGCLPDFGHWDEVLMEKWKWTCFEKLVVLQPWSCVQLFATPWTAAPQAPLSFTISWSSLKLMSFESVLPSNHLILSSPLLLLPTIFPNIRALFQWVGSLHQVAKVLELQLQHQSFQWVFRVDFL